MTTIAYDGKTLCADRQCTINNSRTVEVTKIFTLEHNDCFQAIGFSGNIDALSKVIKKLDNNNYEFEREADDFTALLIDHAGTPWIIEKEGEVLAVDIPWAIGSGSGYAHGAMLGGCTAMKALQIASILDVQTGLGIDEIKIVTN